MLAILVFQLMKIEDLNYLKMELKLIAKEATYFLDLLTLMAILEEDPKELVLIMFLNYGWPTELQQ